MLVMLRAVVGVAFIPKNLLTSTLSPKCIARTANRLLSQSSFEMFSGRRVVSPTQRILMSMRACLLYVATKSRVDIGLPHTLPAMPELLMKLVSYSPSLISVNTLIYQSAHPTTYLPVYPANPPARNLALSPTSVPPLLRPLLSHVLSLR